ncbi:alpha/beta fold hydrolase, partial [Streptomyces niveus]
MEIPTPRRPRPRTRWLAGAAVAAVLVGAGTWTAVASDSTPTVHRADQTMEMPGARIDTSYFTAGDDGDKRRPAVLLGHGFGGSKNDVRAQAEKLARDGYAVLTWSARGFGESTGKI